MSTSIYADVVRVLSSVRSVRAFVRENSYELLQEAHTKLGAALEERKDEYEAEQADRQAREIKRQELLALIQSEGFDLTQLLGDEPLGKRKAVRKSPTPRKPKYVFEENGVTKYWAGVGRKPTPIATAIENGGSLDDFLIPSGQNNQ